MDLPSWATRKVGPLPIAGWAGIGAVAFVLARFLGPQTPTAGSDASAANDPNAASTDLPIPDQSPGALPPTLITTNDQWRQRAFEALLALGVDAFHADRTLAKYLDGERLTADERLIIDKALAAAGLPPDPPPLPLPGPPSRRRHTSGQGGASGAPGGHQGGSGGSTSPGLGHPLPNPSSGYRRVKRITADTLIIDPLA